MRAFSVIDLGFGDAGKGTIVDYLSYKYNPDLVVKSNGGAQCGHNVVLANGSHYCFSQLSSGSFHGIPTYLSDCFLVNPYLLIREIEDFSKYYGNVDVYVDKSAIITTSFHVLANQYIESRRSNRHGSCGKGIGETMNDYLNNNIAVFVEDIFDRKVLRNKLYKLNDIYYEKVNHNDWLGKYEIEEILDYYCDVFPVYVTITDNERMRKMKRRFNTIIYEAGQGVLLDELYGFYPHNSWSNTTFENSKEIDNNIFESDEFFKIGVTRPYLTRHGKGPFPTESSKLSERVSELHNQRGEWQGEFRFGFPDFVLFNYVAKVLKYDIDYIALTHCDEIRDITLVCNEYDNMNYINPTNPKIEPRYQVLEHQQYLATKLFESIPLYEKLNKGDLLFLFRVCFNSEIGLISYGLTCLDKQTYFLPEE